MTEPLHLVPIQPGELFAIWPKVSAWVETACARPGCTLRPVEVFAACANQEALLIVGFDADRALRAVAATSVQEMTDGTRSCWVLLVGGSGAGWSEMLAQVEAGALRSGCSTVEFIGRAGWRRRLPGYIATPHEAGLHYSKNLREAA